MRNQWKRTGLAAILALAILLTGCFAPVLSAAEGAEPYGDGDGAISRAQLAGLYNWLDNTNSDFFSLITFDQISDALGKKGFVKEKDLSAVSEQSIGIITYLSKQIMAWDKVKIILALEQSKIAFIL